MNIQNLLLPFIENIDYEIVGCEIISLAKTRQIEQIISHPEIAAVEASEGIPAVEFQAAYDETILVDETYYENIPTMDELKASAISDVAIAIEEYLADKSELRDPENDCINIVDNRIFSWSFSNIPQPNISQLYDAFLAGSAKNTQAEVNAAAKNFLAESDWYVTRFAETQVAIPAEITAERAAARARIV